MGLEVTVEQLDGANKVVLQGDVDAVSVRSLQKALAPLLQKEPANIILDCGGMKYINSRGIGLLVQSHRQAMVNRGKLILINANARLVRALDLAQVSDSLLFCDTAQDALARLSE